MAKKRKLKKFSKVEAVKALARERIGAPPTLRIVPDRKRKESDKHKPKLDDLLEEN